MPQLVKGGKYIFGWSRVSESGRVCIPKEARQEYHFQPFDKLIIMNGSRTSKGSAITTIDLIRNSPLFNNISKHEALISFQPIRNGYIQDMHHIYTWSEVDEHGCFMISEACLNQYSVHVNDNLLVGRGSGYALAFIKKGPIVEEAVKHSELNVW